MPYDKDGFPIEFYEEEASENAAAVSEEISEPILHVPMRGNFPEAGSDYAGGTCDGWEYKTIFSGSNLQKTYDMVRLFLKEEGYAEVPLPKNAEELKLFRRPQGAQLSLFGETGYAHNPIKILFPAKSRTKNTLILCIYNENAQNHLLRFHGIKTQQ